MQKKFGGVLLALLLTLAPAACGSADKTAPGGVQSFAAAAGSGKSSAQAGARSSAETKEGARRDGASGAGWKAAEKMKRNGAPGARREEEGKETGGARSRVEAEDYITGLARSRAATFQGGDETRIAAAYRWMIENVYFAEPPALDLWRYCCDPDKAPSYLANRALCPLALGVGSCEDFAAALTLLLREMDFEADYVSGLTVSAEGGLVDHAWTVVRLRGAWYHLDCQLEQNVTEGRLRWRYFLKRDEEMRADHIWGRDLAAYWGGRITPEQRARLLAELTPPACKGPAVPAPPEADATLPRRPGQALMEKIGDERAQSGPLAPVELHTTPPIFSVWPQA